MISTDIDETGGIMRIVLRPNQSWSWRANLYLLYTLTAVSGLIGTGFALAGAWVVLPWSALELTALLAAIYHCSRRASEREVITITEHEVKVERGRRSPASTQDYNRSWSSFMIHPRRHPWYPQRVCIRSHGQETELGRFLTDEDRQQLIALLRQSVNNPPRTARPG